MLELKAGVRVKRCLREKVCASNTANAKGSKQERKDGMNEGRKTGGERKEDRS